MKNGAIAVAFAGMLAACTPWVTGCLSSEDDAHGGASSSGSQWLTCQRDSDCSDQARGARCGDAGVCVDASGERIARIQPGDGDGDGRDVGDGDASGDGTVGDGDGDGAGGGSATSDGGAPSYDPCAGKGCGASCTVCPPGDPGCVETAVEKQCDGAGACVTAPAACSGGSGTGVALPDCGSLGASAGGDCSGSDAVPECCDGWMHLRCDYSACTSSAPPSCSGSYVAVVGSQTCGGYQPCAGKVCGDNCSLCEPGDDDCVETAELKFCDAQGRCTGGGAPDCSAPESCELSGADSCGSGQVCCAVGRCGPIENGQGVCEPADPATGGCTPCACEDQPGGCPICNSPDTPIATPDGERPIAELHEGDLVLSMHRGELTAVPVIATRSVAVFDHAVVRLSLDNGRSIEVSGSHPTADGRRLDSLRPGDRLGEARVLGVELVPYTHERTYDILPASDSGSYLAAGALLGSTLH